MSSETTPFGSPTRRATCPTAWRTIAATTIARTPSSASGPPSRLFKANASHRTGGGSSAERYPRSRGEGSSRSPIRDAWIRPSSRRWHASRASSDPGQGTARSLPLGDGAWRTPGTCGSSPRSAARASATSMPCPTADTARAARTRAGRCARVAVVASKSYASIPSTRHPRRVRNDPSRAAFERALKASPFASRARTRSPSLLGTRSVSGRSGSATGALIAGASRVSRCRSAASSAGSRRRQGPSPATIAWYRRQGEGGHSAPW